MMTSLYRILVLGCMLVAAVSSYPIESKPLNSNPESWNLSWLDLTPRNSSNPSSESFVSSDPHVKKSKITPKSIFIAPSAHNARDKICPHGFRIDDNGKCIKTVTINQDDILAARLSDLFGVDTSSSNKDVNIDSDYYDFDEDKNEGPLQINLPLAIEVEEETADGGGKKVEYIVAEKITMRNFNPKNVRPAASEDVTTIVPAPVTEKLVDDTTTIATTEMPLDDDKTTVVFSTDEPMTTVVDTADTTTPESTTVSTTTTTTPTPTTTASTTSTTTSTTTAKTTTTTTENIPIIILPTITSAPPIELYKINSVEFMPKITKKTNRNRSKNNDKRIRRPISPQTSESYVLRSQPLTEQLPIPKKNRTRTNAKRRKPTKSTEVSTTTAATTTTVKALSTTLKPYFWLPKGWTIDESQKEKPVLIRFWAEQPAKVAHDERARSHNSRHQRMNSRQPTEGIFREIAVPELDSLISEK